MLENVFSVAAWAVHLLLTTKNSTNFALLILRLFGGYFRARLLSSNCSLAHNQFAWLFSANKNDGKRVQAFAILKGSKLTVQVTVPSKCRLTSLIVRMQMPSSLMNLTFSDSVRGTPLTSQVTVGSGSPASDLVLNGKRFKMVVLGD